MSRIGAIQGKGKRAQRAIQLPAGAQKSGDFEVGSARNRSIRTAQSSSEQLEGIRIDNTVGLLL